MRALQDFSGSGGPVLNIAHRGARSVAPENTVAAIEKAALLGADAVEIDVQLTADGSIVVFHDDELTRCTDARRRFPDRRPWSLSEFDIADLRRLDAGRWFVDELDTPAHHRQAWLRALTAEEREAYILPEDLAHYASGAVTVPLLSECLAACKGLSLCVHIELKSIPRFYPQLAEKVVAQVRESGMEHAAVISSFDHTQLPAIAALAPDIRTAVLTSDRLYRPAEYLARLGASAYNPCCSGECDTLGLGSITDELDVGMIADVRAAGYDVYVWTENDPARMTRLVDAGVTGIITDYPNRLSALLASRGAQ